MRLPCAVAPASLAFCVLLITGITGTDSNGQVVTTASPPDLERADEILATSTAPLKTPAKCDRACLFCLCRLNSTHYNGTRCSCDVEPFKSSRLCRRCNCWFWIPKDIYNLSPVEIMWLILSVLTPFIGAMPGMFVLRRNVRSWYSQLEQPTWAPPNWIHLPLGFLLYASTGYASWLVYRSGGGMMAMCLYVAQLVLNWIWPIIFFHYHNLKLASFEIVFSWVIVVLCGIEFYLFHASAGVLMMPYVVWLTFAVFLNVSLWRLNGDNPRFASKPKSVIRRRDSSDIEEENEKQDKEVEKVEKVEKKTEKAAKAEKTEQKQCNIIGKQKKLWEVVKMKLLYPLMTGQMVGQKNADVVKVEEKGDAVVDVVDVVVEKKDEEKAQENKLEKENQIV